MTRATERRYGGRVRGFADLNAFGICQALSWLAKERRDLQDQIAVSYTHLDVYKRQGCQCPTGKHHLALGIRIVPVHVEGSGQ